MRQTRGDENTNKRPGKLAILAQNFFWEVGEWGCREGFRRMTHDLVIPLYSAITTDVVSGTRGSWKRDYYYPGLLFKLKDAGQQPGC